MKHTRWKTMLFWILLTEAVGAVAALLTQDAARLYSSALVKPPLSPPAAVFPVVWTLLYALMGYAAARIALRPGSMARGGALRLYLVQLGFNFFWSILFFSLRAYGPAFVWLAALWALIVRLFLLFHELDEAAGLVLLPYLVWVFFAGYLNCAVWLLNR